MVAGQGWQNMLRRIGRDMAGFARCFRTPEAMPGLYSYRFRPPGGLRQVHLRIDRDGEAVLLIDASEAIYLNRTAALLARAALERRPRAEAVAIARRLGAGRQEAERAAAVVYRMIENLAASPDCPICAIDGPSLLRIEPFSRSVAAPLKADLALSYGCNNACGHCYNEPGRRTMPSLDAAGWRAVLDRLAAIGVPQAIFTGGEPTLFPGLVELVRHASALGLICGMNTNGRRLSDLGLAEQLAAAGLNHAQITLESSRAEVHNAMTGKRSFDETLAGVRNAVAAGLHAITNTTLTRRNVDDAEEMVDLAAELGLAAAAFNGMIYSGRGCLSGEGLSEEELLPVLVALRDRAAALGVRMLWYTPTPYCKLSPQALELGPRRCNAGEYSMCIEPNGDVLPCQSYYQSAGNLLADPWESIWHSSLFRGFRERTLRPRESGLPEECFDCPDLAVCGGGCRLQRERGGK